MNNEKNDKETLEEMLKFIKNMDKKGRPEAEAGYHDDLVMALAISFYIRTEQSFKLLPEKIKEIKLLDSSDLKNNQYFDIGSEIEII